MTGAPVVLEHHVSSEQVQRTWMPTLRMQCAGCGAHRQARWWRALMFCNRDCEAQYNTDGPHPDYRDPTGGRP